MIRLPSTQPSPVFRFFVCVILAFLGSSSTILHAQRPKPRLQDFEVADHHDPHGIQPIQLRWDANMAWKHVRWQLHFGGTASISVPVRTSGRAGEGTCRSRALSAKLRTHPPQEYPGAWRLRDIHGLWEARWVAHQPAQSVPSDDGRRNGGSPLVFQVHATGTIQFRGSEVRFPRFEGQTKPATMEPGQWEMTIDLVEPSSEAVLAWNVGHRWLPAGSYLVGLHERHLNSHWQVVRVMPGRTSYVGYPPSPPPMHRSVEVSVAWDSLLNKRHHPELLLLLAPTNRSRVQRHWQILLEEPYRQRMHQLRGLRSMSDATVFQYTQRDPAITSFQLFDLPSGPWNARFPNVDEPTAWRMRTVNGAIQVDTVPWKAKGPAPWGLHTQGTPKPLWHRASPDSFVRIQARDDQGMPTWSGAGIGFTAFADESMGPIPSQIAVGLSGHATQYFQASDFQIDPTRASTPMLKVHLQPGFAVHWTVLDAARTPIPGARVHALGNPLGPLLGTTDFKGEVIIRSDRHPSALLLHYQSQTRLIHQTSPLWQPYQTILITP